MGIITPCIYFDILAITLSIVAIVLTVFHRAFKYWKDRGLPYLEPSIPFGNTVNPLTRTVTFGEIIADFYEEFRRRGLPHGGAYILLQPVYIPVSPEMLRNILVKDFKHFMDRGMFYNERDDPLSANLFSIEGTKWKNLRAKLTPTFTSGKMKLMFNTLLECSEQLKEAMDEYCKRKEAIDIKEVLGCYTTDVIGSCAFGLECNSFKNPNSEFRTHGRNIFKVSRSRALKNAITFSFPNLAKFLRFKSVNPEAERFFLDLVRDTVQYRKENDYCRKDFMQLLIDMKNEDSSDGLSVEQMAAQAFVFFLAGFETSSATMSFCLYELSVNDDLQEKTRREIVDVLEKHGGKITYEAIQDMKYLGQVVDETLRLYPPGSALVRKCTENYRIEDSNIVLEKGTGVLIPILGLHKDPGYFPDPEEFDPDRFSDENKSKIPTYAYMPFGEGPRVCIGLRFGLMQAKVGLAILLKNYKFHLNAKTQTPLQMDPRSLVLTAKGGIWLQACKLT